MASLDHSPPECAKMIIHETGYISSLDGCIFPSLIVVCSHASWLAGCINSQVLQNKEIYESFSETD